MLISRITTALAALAGVAVVVGDKRCGTDSLVSFTGFKFHRQYKISGLMPSTQQFVSLYHCNHGTVDYEKLYKQKSINQILWDKPFCMLKPRLRSYLGDLPEDTVESLAGTGTGTGSNGDSASASASGPMGSNGTRASTTGPFCPRVLAYVRTKLDKLLEKITTNKPILYTSKQRDQHIQDIQKSTLQASLEWESRNLVCYKLARRRKYSKRDISFYSPQTFIGGLFECPIPPTKKKEVFSDFSLGDTLKTFDFECESKLARPIAPLIADYAARQWWDVNWNIFSPKLVHNIPYLTTANPLNLRFSLTETPDMSSDSWATKIKVNEDYDFSELDIHYMSQAMAKCADIIYKLLEPVDFQKLLGQKAVEYKIAGRPISEHDKVISTVKLFSTDQKLGILLGMDGEVGRVIGRLQGIWDDIDFLDRR